MGEHLNISLLALFVRHRAENTPYTTIPHIVKLAVRNVYYLVKEVLHIVLSPFKYGRYEYGIFSVDAAHLIISI